VRRAAAGADMHAKEDDVMRRLTVFGACFFLAAVLIAGMSSAAQAKPSSVLEGVVKAWQGKALILEIRKCMDDKTYEFTVLKDGAVKMMKSEPGKKDAEVETTRKYNLDKVKQLKAGAGNAMWTIMKLDELKGKSPNIRAITLRENEKTGELEFLVHLYHPTDKSYRKTRIVYAKDWTVDKDELEMKDPRLDVWEKTPAEGEAAGEASEGKAGEAGIDAAKPAAAPSDKPKGGAEEK